MFNFRTNFVIHGIPFWFVFLFLFLTQKKFFNLSFSFVVIVAIHMNIIIIRFILPLFVLIICGIFSLSMVSVQTTPSLAEQRQT